MAIALAAVRFDDCVRLPRCASTCRSVGKSKTRVSGSSAASASRTASRLRNSTAPSESSPASISGASAEALGSSSAATSRTAADASPAALLAVSVIAASIGIVVLTTSGGVTSPMVSNGDLPADNAASIMPTLQMIGRRGAYLTECDCIRL